MTVLPGNETNTKQNNTFSRMNWKFDLQKYEF